MQHRSAVSASIIMLVAGAAIAAPDTIPWRNPGSAEIGPEVMPRVALAAAKTTETRVVVTFDRAPTPAERLALEQAGLRILTSLTGQAFFATPTRALDVERVLGAAPVASVRPILVDQKLDQRIAGAEVPGWAVVRTEDPRDPAVTPANPIVGTYVMLHADAPVTGADIVPWITGLGGEVRDFVLSINTVVIELPFSKVRELAADDRVQWVEPPLPRMSHTNASNRIVTQVDDAHALPYGLTGAGVTALIYDGGTARATHDDFGMRMTVLDSSGTADHATHVSGTVGGAGIANAAHRGMAPATTLLSAGFEWDGSGTFLYTNPGDVEADYSTGLAMGADITNNSIGSNVEPNGFNCSFTGDYGLMAATIDAIARGSLGEPLVIFWAAGNERQGSRCGNQYFTTAPPANNKNAISVGALNSNDDSVTSFTSWGPSDDGRIRPVVSAPGCQIGGDGGVTSSSSGGDTAYSVKCGTSMASPTACGIGALIIEDWRTIAPGDTPSPQLMRSWLAHCAEDIGNPGPDNQSGYGSIRVVDTIDFVRQGFWKEQVVDQGTVSSHSITVNPGDPELKVTIAWDDPPGTPNVNPNLVNNLDLVVVDPSGTQHFPWTIDPASPGAPAVKTQADQLNNMEQVQVDSPMPGQWRVDIVGTSVPQGPQGFAMATSPNLGGGLLSVAVTSSVPDLQLPGTPLDVETIVTENAESLVPGTVVLNYRFDGGSYIAVPLTEDTPGTYPTTIPAADCDDLVEFYVSAEGTISGVINSPPGGTSTPLTVGIGEIATILYDDAETDIGWTATATATAGQWERGVPVNCARSDPPADADGSGQAWLTDNDAIDCNSDVDGGSVTLTSPIFDLSGTVDPTLSYSRWFENTSGDADRLLVEISDDDGGSWTELESVSSSGGWVEASFRVLDFVGLTSQVRLRFSADDNPNNSVTEAGLDALQITDLTCDGGPGPCSPADLAEPFDTLDFFDVLAFLDLFDQEDPAADLGEPFGVWDFFDVLAYLDLFDAGCS